MLQDAFASVGSHAASDRRKPLRRGPRPEGRNGSLNDLARVGPICGADSRSRSQTGCSICTLQLRSYAAASLWARESEMVAWLNPRREPAGWMRAEPDAPIHDVGVDAFSEARRREREAKSRAEGKNWARIALAVVQRTAKGLGLGAATRMATEAGVVTNGAGAAS